MSCHQLLFASPVLNVIRVKTIVLKKTTPANYSLFITFKLKNITPSSHWLFGFYSPQTFNHSNKVNPKLSMHICSRNDCVPLKFVTKPNIQPKGRFYDNIYGDGFAQVLTSVANHFKLKPNHVYTIKLENSNQQVPQNLSKMPQNFFVYLQKNKQFITSTASIDAYGGQTLANIGGYDGKTIKKNIKDRINKNYAECSLPISTKEPEKSAYQYHLIPTPKRIVPLNSLGIDLHKLRSIAILDNFNDINLDSIITAYISHDLHILSKTIVAKTSNDETIVFNKTKNIKNPEGYKLTINNNKIILSASTTAGIFYGIQTLRQLWNQAPNLPALIITDAPRFKYRGILLDTARHFFSIRKIKELIDLMGAQKLNTLHIHFSDDEGWRLALNALLDEYRFDPTGLWLRGYLENSINPPQVFSQANLDKTNYQWFDPLHGLELVRKYSKANDPYKYFYTRKDINMLIKYANARMITIIPEIDFPGHARALVNAYPNIFYNPHDNSDYLSVQAYYDDVLPICLYGKTTPAPALSFTTVTNAIIKEINAWFSNQSTIYAKREEVSVGGDEVAADAWTKDSSCVGKWKALSALEKSHLFFKELFAANPTIKLSGWQQFVQNDDVTIGKYSLSSKDTGHVWVWEPVAIGGDQQAISLAKAGYSTVIAFADHLYFDIAYTPNAWEPGFNWAAPYSDTYQALSSIVNVNNVLQQLSHSKRNNIVGLEGGIWSENMMNFRHLIYMAFPKMTGLAEAAWAPKSITAGIGVNKTKVNWKGLLERLGTNKNEHGFLWYLNNIGYLKDNNAIGEYRGFPNGMKSQIPSKSD